MLHAFYFKTNEERTEQAWKVSDHDTRDVEYLTDAQEMVRKQAAWRLRISKRETFMFRLRRAGELAMSTTVASLGVFGVVESFSKDRIGSTAISAIAILWSLGVGRVAIQDLNSQQHMDLVNTTARERVHYDAAVAMLEPKPDVLVEAGNS